MAGTSYFSRHRLTWIFATFAFPKRMRYAAKFRELPLNERFETIRFSDYTRFCNSKVSFDSRLVRTERNLPEKGDVRVLTFTDQQYENIARFSSQRRRRQRRNPDQLAMF